MNLLGTLAILLAALVVTAEAHGVETGSKHMVEWPAGIKGLLMLVKNPLFIVTTLGAMAGSAVMTRYQEKDRLTMWLMHTAVSIALTPLVIRWFGQEPALDTFAGFACIIGVSSHVIIKIWAEKRIHEALTKGAVHQIEERLGTDEPEAEKVEK